MKQQKTVNSKKTVLPPNLLIKLYTLYQIKDPLPYSYLQIGSKHGIAKMPHIQSYVNHPITCLIAEVMKRSGIYETADSKTFNCMIGYPTDIDVYKNCECYQKVNHFCGGFLLGRKSELDYRMEELLPLFPELKTFYPMTFALPRNRKSFDMSIKSRRYWIFKPNHSYCGKFIEIYDSNQPLSSVQIDFNEFKGVVQEYIERPLTIFGKKFDLRLYALVTSLRPLKIYLNTQGLARFCPKKYSFDNLESGCHLTNFTLHKDDPDFVFSSQSKTENAQNCKWSLRFFLSFLSVQMKIDVHKLMMQFEKIIITTLITAITAMRICQESRTKHRKLCYELFGFDILIDENLNCYLLEVNMNPNMSGEHSVLDYKMKYSLNLDMLRIANIIDFDLNTHKIDKLKNKIFEYEKKFSESISNERRESVEINGFNPWDDPVFADFEIVRDLIDELVKKSSSPQKAALVSDYFDINEEIQITKCKHIENDKDFKGTFSEKGHFRLIYPTPENVQLYSHCFGTLRYEDVVLHKWILLPDNEKLKIIEDHLNGYEIQY